MRVTVTLAVIGVCLILMSCEGGADQNPQAATAPEADGSQANMIPASTAIAANAEFNRCLNRWRERIRLQEQMLRSERRAREALLDRIGDGSADDREWIEILRRDEERAERNRIEFGDLYQRTDPSTTCFTD